ncbi:bifunctional DNA primase/helicase [Dysgonomonas sp. 25]|uniref:bifunctional DNA primase/helicase n=1 Tax=Dysgonomonas sp. 25 TaxID=2302933 RepID=UPI0013D33A8D|nr:bifunctional DNA primase/helicase [Dysgonomonas sp. 25]NDV69229.1 bifunctional DNA primase/helicase [Dysgonomonas sp. 25]
MKTALEKLGIHLPYGRTDGKVKVICPKCCDQRQNRLDRALSVDIGKGLYNCHYCGWSGSVRKRKGEKSDKVYKRPEWHNNTTLSDRLVKWFEARRISQYTLKKMRISEGEEFMPQKGKKCNTVQFNYFVDDRLVNVKYRTGDKCFKLVSGAELVVWNIDAIKGQPECIVTEGEIDALSFIECGFDHTVSVPNGANGTEYLDNYLEAYFDDKETIFIASDNDSKGIALRNNLIARFGAERCRIVSYGEGCKDANEHLVKYGQHSLAARIREAEDVKIDGVYGLNDFADDLDNLYLNGMPKGHTIGHPNFDALCSFETGRLAIVTGIPGHGKSEFVDEITVLLNMRYGMKFAYFSPENHPTAYLLSKLTSKLTGKRFDKAHLNRMEYTQAKEYLNKNFSFIYPSDNFTLDEILGKAQYLIRRRGVKGLVIDPYNKIEHQIPPGMPETNYISMILDRLIAFAQKNDILILLVAHPRKMQKKQGEMTFEVPTLYDINGSANFYNKTDYGIAVYRDFANDRVEVYVQKVKFRHLGECGSASFRYNINNGRYVPCNDEGSADWDNDNYLTRKEREQQPADFFTTDESVPF